MADLEPTALGLDAGGWVAAAMLAVFALLLWKKIPALVAGMLDKRIAEVSAQLESASRLRAEAEALKAEYEAKAKAMVKDAEVLLAHAESESAALIAQAAVDAKAIVARRTQMAKDKIAAAERTAVADVRARAVDASVAAARKLIVEGHGAPQDKALVSDAIGSLN